MHYGVHFSSDRTSLSDIAARSYNSFPKAAFGCGSQWREAKSQCIPSNPKHTFACAVDCRFVESCRGSGDAAVCVSILPTAAAGPHPPIPPAGSRLSFPPSHPVAPTQYRLTELRRQRDGLSEEVALLLRLGGGGAGGAGIFVFPAAGQEGERGMVVGRWALLQVPMPVQDIQTGPGSISLLGVPSRAQVRGYARGGLTVAPT